MTNEFVALLEKRAGDWLAALSAEQRALASFDITDEDERRSWAYFLRMHAGLPLHDMDMAQQKLAHNLVAASLSLAAYAKVCSIMAMESVLRAMEGGGSSSPRDVGRYFFSVFGAPGDEAWGFRVEGHHVCLNFSIAGGEVVGVTPLFLGSNPAEVRHGDYAVARPMGEEQDAGLEMLASLDADQKKIAVLSREAPPDFVLLNAPEIPDRALPGEVGAMIPLQQALSSMPKEQRQSLAFDRAGPKGLPASEMTVGQRKKLNRLVRVYVERVPDEMAAMEMGRIGVGSLSFAWAGAGRPGEGHYYRVQGGPLLIEYDNTQDGANHVHAVWRDMERDFGGDVLRRHLGREHAS